MMNIHWTSCGKHYMVYVSQIIKLYMLNLHSAVYKLYLNNMKKKGKNMLLRTLSRQWNQPIRENIANDTW